MPIIFTVGKLPDKTVIELFEAIEAEFGNEHLSFQAAEVAFTGNRELLKARKTPSYLITNASIGVRGHGFSVSFARESNRNTSPYYDEITINIRNNPVPAAEDLVKLENLIRDRVKFPTVSLPDKPDRAVIGLFEKEMATIASMHEKLLADALELRQTYELQDAERRAQFEKDQREAQAAQQQLEEESLARIQAEKDVLEEKIKNFDFSDHMRARRKLREDITADVQGAIQRPVTTIQSTIKLMMVAVFCAGAATLSGFFAFESFQAFISLADRSAVDLNALLAHLTSSGQPTTPPVAQAAINDNTYLLWMLAVRGILLSAVAVAFTYYVVSMLRKSYDEDVRSLRELQRYGMDINRASWVIETAMEMTTKEGAALPERWIEGATAGLFQVGSHKESEVNSLAALGAVMGLGPEVSVGPDGAHLKLSPKAAKKAAADGD
ncbi:hypothetical protein [Sinorhizobium meliloti]|uniref:hypothetical protein n=1 Tax=Rhizobium meliloti TaxID=382 RepID=UPI000FD70B84|nr:hypothetical protein [Sinorhizobium meliloti]RVH24507.1 hypothetical protein CN215_17665 [Sinorhizobium meliloti]